MSFRNIETLISLETLILKPYSSTLMITYSVRFSVYRTEERRVSFNSVRNAGFHVQREFARSGKI
jgi:hypothetical protein